MSTSGHEPAVATVERCIIGLVGVALLTTACSSGVSRLSHPSPAARASSMAAGVLSASTVQLGGAPWGITIDGDGVWVSDASRAPIWRVDARRAAVVPELRSGAPDPRDSHMATAAGQLWVTNLGGTVGLLDARTGEARGWFPTGGGEPASTTGSPSRVDLDART